MTRKVEPGRCDVCGCAIVKPEFMMFRNGWKNGHFYTDGELVSVRCTAHGGQGFEHHQVYDVTSNCEFGSDSDVPRKVWRR